MCLAGADTNAATLSDGVWQAENKKGTVHVLSVPVLSNTVHASTLSQVNLLVAVLSGSSKEVQGDRHRQGTLETSWQTAHQ